MTYFDWLRNKGCGCNNGCKDINPCSCDEILLEISNLHTDDQVLQTEIDDLSGKVETISGIVDTKLDASAITEYSTSQEVDDAINAAVSGKVDTSDFETFSGNVETEIDTKLDASAYTPTDLSNYYNKQEVNYIVESAITDVESEIPSLSGYATEQWVLDKHYITGVDLSDYYTKEEVDDIADDKLDASAYTPTDLSNYYNKQEVNDIVVSSITEVESEIPSLSGYATEQWVEDKNYLTEHQPLKTINGQVISGTGNIEIEASGTSVTVDDHLDSASTNPVQNKVIVGALNNKLDVSAYTPTDLSNYYTKDEVNSAITKVESEIPSLSGYATEQWVESQGYLTDVDLSDYALTADTYTKTESDNKFQTKGNYITYSEFIKNINNIQEQINSLISTISGCCGSSGETIYRWITLTGQDDYICSGTTKYTKEQQQQSTDNGLTWSNVVPAQYRQGKIVETESTDCGYIPPTPTGGTKFSATYSGGTTYSAECDGEGTLRSSTTKPSGYDYSGMTSAVIGYCVKTIGSTCFSHCISLSSVTIPNSVVSIGSNSFSYCSGLTSVTIPNGVTSIGGSVGYTFNHCYGLISIDIPDSVTSIGQGAFHSCTGLTSVTIGSGVKNIGLSAFAFCSSLTSIVVKATTPPTLGNYAFSNTNNCPIYVPAQSVNAYKSADGWSAYANRIRPIS